MRPVTDVLAELGIEVLSERTRSDGSLEINSYCPYHFDGGRIDDNPSWWINDTSGEFICFSCDFSGGLPFLVHKVRCIPYGEALAFVHSTDDLSVLDRLDAGDDRRRYEIPPMNEARIRAFDDVPDETLANRRISREAADFYGIRWDPRQNGWVFPIRSAQTHEILGYQLKGDNRLFRNLPMSVPKSTTLFGIDRIDGGDVVLVESPLDAALIYTLGYPAMATFGAAWSTTQLDLAVISSDRLTIAFDNDEAGRKATIKILGLIPSGERNSSWPDYSQRLPVRFFNYQGLSAKDPGEMTDMQIIEGLKGSRGSLGMVSGLFS